MQVNGLVATILGLCVMLILCWSTDHLAIKVVGVTFTNGFILMRFFVWMHHDANTHVLRTTPTVVGDMAGVGSSAHWRRCHWMLDGGIIQAIGG